MILPFKNRHCLASRGLPISGCLFIAMSTLANDFVPTVSVSGTSQVSVVPDRVVLRASIETRGKSIAEAKQDNDRRIRDVMSLLEQTKIDSKDIQSTIMQIEPIYPHSSKQSSKYGNQQIQADQIEDGQLQPVGYRVRRGLTIMVRQLSAFERLYEGLIRGGVNLVEGIEFETSQVEQHQMSALRDAIQTAKTKAELLAKEMGAKVKGVRSITERSAESYGYDMAGYGGGMEDLFGNAPPSVGKLAAGQIKITAHVDAIFSLSDQDFQE